MWIYVYPNNTETEITNLYIGIPNPESITLDKSSLSLTTVWQTEQLTATLTPTPCDQRIIWTTTNHTVATVSTTGLVTCVTPWECTITAITANGLTASCSVAQWWTPWANTIAYYPLTSVSTVNDMSGNWNHWTMSWTITFGSALWWVDCWSFPWSSSTYINVPNSSDFATTTITYSFWIASSQTSGNRWIIYKWPFTWNSWTYYITNYRNFWVSINGTETYTTMFYSNNQWVYAVVTYDGSSMKIYKNWALNTSASTSYDISWDSNPLKIWAYWDSNYCFYGYMSEIIIENKVWTAEEISDYYNQTKSLYGIS